MMKYILFILFTISVAEAYTLNNNFGASFKDHSVKVFIDESTTCDVGAANVTVSDLEGMVKSAVNKFWNTVPTSKLRLKPSGFSPRIPTMNEGVLCSPTDDECITAANTAGGIDADEGLITPVNDIVIGCNNNGANFTNTSIIAVTIPNNFSGKKIKGAVILLNNIGTAFGALSRDDKISVIAHEIGHAIGLGHPEDNPEALMYYRTVDQRRHLSQDDIDGVTYLYPIHVDVFGLMEGGLLGGCGTITDKNEPPSNPPFLQMGITLGLFILISEILRLLNRSKARPTA